MSSSSPQYNLLALSNKHTESQAMEIKVWRIKTQEKKGSTNHE